MSLKLLVTRTRVQGSTVGQNDRMCNYYVPSRPYLWTTDLLYFWPVSARKTGINNTHISPDLHVVNSLVPDKNDRQWKIRYWNTHTFISEHHNQGLRLKFNYFLLILFAIFHYCLAKTWSCQGTCHYFEQCQRCLAAPYVLIITGNVQKSCVEIVLQF